MGGFTKGIPVDQLAVVAGQPGLVEMLKWITVFWAAVFMANHFVRKYTPGIMSWYPLYSTAVGIVLTVALLYLAS